MRVLLLYLTYCLGLNSLHAQGLEGKWKGYFSPNNSQFSKVYSYEMDITQGPNEQLTISTFTKLSNEFSAHAYATGRLDKTTLLVHIEEQGFLDLSIQENYAPCLMNNFMVYKNLRGHEIIEGTYTSYNKKTGKDCGGGKLYLEKEIPIQKLIASEKAAKKTITEKPNELVVKQNIPLTKTTINTTQLAKKSSAEVPKSAKPNNTNKENPAVIAKNTPPKNVSENLNSAIKNAQVNSVKEEPVMEESFLNEPEDLETEIRIKQGNGFQTIPWVLVGRENKLVKKIITHNKTISIDLYDNGTIDNDTIIVYDNKQLIVNKKRLSYKAIHFDLNFSATNNEHEIIIVAHNMGTVPPNTALLVYKDSLLRQELFITSTNKMNAKLIIVYEPPKENPN